MRGEATRVEAFAGRDVFAPRGGAGVPRTERPISGPAAEPLTAPATSPTGPSTMAPDSAPSAAEPARSCAHAGDASISTPMAAMAMMVRIRASPVDPEIMWRRMRLQLGANVEEL